MIEGKLGDFEFHSAMKPREVARARQLIESHPEFAGIMISQDAPLPAEKALNGEVSVVIKMPRSIYAPDFWEKLSGVLNEPDPVVEAVEKTVSETANSPQQKKRDTT